MSGELERLHSMTRRRGQGYDRAMAAWRAYRAYAREVAARLPFTWLTVGCDNPTQNHTGYANGADHIVVREAVMVGRIKRVAGDALCKPLAQFHGNLWGERGGDPPTCKRCLEIAERFTASGGGSAC